MTRRTKAIISRRAGTSLESKPPNGNILVEIIGINGRNLGHFEFNPAEINRLDKHLEVPIEATR